MAKAILHPLAKRNTLISILIDISALGFIYLVPTLSHLLNLPVYLIEPMRLMLILSLVHTSRRNAYLLALTMPIFSFLVSGHPEFAKMLLITFELSLNVFLFFLLAKKFKYIFPSILLSIILSKTIYYILKFGLIKMTVINSGLISTSIVIQLITTIVFSSYVYLFFKKNPLS